MATKPITPSPAHEAIDIAVNSVMTWVDGGASDSYKVYFGTDQTNVTNGDTSVYRGDVTTERYDPRVILTLGATYYWRIDAVEGEATATGDVWSFTVVSSSSNIDSKKYKKRLVALADDKFWYEDISSQPSSMTALAGFTPDTSTEIDMVEAFQKVFIVNGASKKVIDFSSTKIVAASWTDTKRPTFGMILQNTTAGKTAEMVVTYYDGVNTVYGFNTTDDTFLDTNTVSGTNDDGDAVGLVLNGDGVAPTVPQVYDWKTFGNVTDATAAAYKGEMPGLATIMCRYRGRIVLAGNSAYPHQWYMTRQGNPFDLIYMEGDAQSAVTGANADFGEIGDIVKALIPFSDDYMLFGCVNSMWLLAGDPANGGSLDKFVDTGIFSKNAWCMDGTGSLYWVGNDGIYKVGRGFASFENLTINKLPNLISDLALDADKQTATMGYDARNHGIEICVTSLEDGSNSNYWFDLRTNGFFPESYQTDHAVFSQFNYQADESNYKRLMVGCNDGFIRTFDTANKNDDDTAISSYAVIGPKPLADDYSKGMIDSLVIVSGGGASGGSELDTDGLTCELFTADTTEEVIENIKAGSTAKYSYTQTGPGRTRIKRPRRSGVAAGFKLSNSTVDQTWAMEKITIDVKKAGKVR